MCAMLLYYKLINNLNFINMPPTLQYLKYVFEHKVNVFLEGRKLHLPIHQLLIHDLSKFSKFEFKQYKEFYFGKYSIKNPSVKIEGSDAYNYHTNFVKKDFQMAWLNHQNHNRHHWQYWLMVKNHQIVALDMPHKYAVEMIVDWNAMSKKFKQNTFDWYKEQKDIILSDSTRLFVEYVLTTTEKHKSLKNLMDNYVNYTIKELNKQLKK